MSDVQNRIEELEKRACEKDLLSLLASNREVRIRTEQHARNFRLAALRLMIRQTTLPPE